VDKQINYKRGYTVCRGVASIYLAWGLDSLSHREVSEEGPQIGGYVCIRGGRTRFMKLSVTKNCHLDNWIH